MTVERKRQLKPGPAGKTAERARYIQLMNQGFNNAESSRMLGIGRKTGSKWRNGYRTTGAHVSAGGPGQFKFWVGDGQEEALKYAITADQQQQFPGMHVQVDRMDYASQGDPFATVQLAVGGIAGLVLLLGAVGMLNISMVTVRYRVREIGIRRSSAQHPPASSSA